MSTSHEEQVLSILQKAYQVEVDGHTFYSMIADKTKLPAVGEIFTRLAADESEHMTYLHGISEHFRTAGATAFAMDRKAPDLRIFADQILSDRFRSQAKGAAFETSALSIGMQLESNAISTFSTAAKNASEGEIKAFFEFLAKWEMSHMDALHRLYEGVRVDFWEKNGFAPF